MASWRGDCRERSSGDEFVSKRFEFGIVSRRHHCSHEQSAARTLDRPPPMKLLPRHWPDCRVHGARPARAAICRRSSDPSSGSSAISVRAIVGPIPGTEASRSSFLGQAGEPLTWSEMSSSRRSIRFSALAKAAAMPFFRRRRVIYALPFGSYHLNDLAPAADEIGEHCVVSSAAIGEPAAWLPPRNARLPRHRSDRSWHVGRAPARTPAPGPD